MKANISESFGMVSERQISDFEQRHGVAVPPVYKQFLYISNGGRSDRSAFDVPGWPGQGSILDFFFGIGAGDEASIEWWINELDTRIPVGFIPVGIDQGANLVLVGTAGKYLDQIWYWDSSYQFELSDKQGTVFKIADNIDQMLEQLAIE